jgi:hypothetical protein
LTSTVWAVWLIQSSTAFFTRETLTRSSHSIRVDEPELAQEIWRAAERAGGDVQTSGAAVEAAGRSERRKRVQRGDHRFADIPPSRIAGG